MKFAWENEMTAFQERIEQLEKQVATFRSFMIELEPVRLKEKERQLEIAENRMLGGTVKPLKKVELWEHKLSSLL